MAKYGGTVHGATLLKGLLEKENAPEVQALGGECDSEEWRAFCSALIKLGSAMEALTMSENIGAAVDNCR